MPYLALRCIAPPYGRVYNAPPAVLPHRIVVHASINLCAAISVEVVTIDGSNHMIRCSHTVATQVGDFFHDYGGGGLMFLLVSRLGIPGSHPIAILLPFLPFVPSEGTYASYPSAICSSI